MEGAADLYPGSRAGAHSFLSYWGAEIIVPILYEFPDGSGPVCVWLLLLGSSLPLSPMAGGCGCGCGYGHCLGNVLREWPWYLP